MDVVLLTIRSCTSNINDAASEDEEGSFMDANGQVIFASIVLTGAVLLVGILHLVSKYSLR